MTEKTIKSYQEPGKRIQLVRINFENNSPYYQIRENRQIKRTHSELIDALKFYRAKVDSLIVTTRLDL